MQEDDGQGEGVRWRNVWGNVRRSIKELPLPVRRVCYGPSSLSSNPTHLGADPTTHPSFHTVQFFAWTSWFPFLFYSTTYVAETLYSSLPPSAPLPSPDAATRAGSLALLLYALVALAAGALLPFLCTLGRRPIVDRWISRTSRGGRATRWVMAECTPRNCWTAGLVTYAVGMVGTFWVSDVRGAMVVIAWLGVPWAVNCWVSLEPALSAGPTVAADGPLHHRSLSPSSWNPSAPCKLHPAPPPPQHTARPRPPPHAASLPPPPRRRGDHPPSAPAQPSTNLSAPSPLPRYLPPRRAPRPAAQPPKQQ